MLQHIDDAHTDCFQSALGRKLHPYEGCSQLLTTDSISRGWEVFWQSSTGSPLGDRGFGEEKKPSVRLLA